MSAEHERIDLTRGDASAPLHTRVFYLLRDLQRGRALELVVDEDPDLLLEAVNFQLRRRLRWEVAEAGAGRWVVRVRHRDDGRAAGLMDLMVRDHERLDRLLAGVLAELNAGRTGAPLAEFATALRRHVEVENEILAPHFGAQPQGPTAVMFEDHERILAELDLVLESATGPEADPAQAAAYAAMLSGSMAKHEGREERELFPYWEERFRRDGDSGLLDRVQAVLEGRTGPGAPGDGVA